MRWPRRSRRSDGSDDRAGRPDETERARARMVAAQLEARGITDPDVLGAFRAVPRHLFVDGDDPYGDHAMPVGSGQTISQPYVVARMTVVARPPRARGWEGANVLEIGTGSGYQAAILAALGARVTSIERHPELAAEARRKLDAAGVSAEQVRIEVADGTEGWPADAPYASILVTAAGPSVPEPLLRQLDPEGGRIVMPVGDREHQVLTLVIRRGDAYDTVSLDPVVFVPLIGRHGVADG